MKIAQKVAGNCTVQLATIWGIEYLKIEMMKSQKIIPLSKLLLIIYLTGKVYELIKCEGGMEIVEPDSSEIPGTEIPDELKPNTFNLPKDHHPPRVTLKQGSFIGKMQTSRAGRDFYSFIGIKYALTTVRFQQMAELPEASNAIFNATSFGPICKQHDWFKSKILGEEDCLYINVYTPKLPSSLREVNSDSSSVLLPVMMYIHGGAFLFGSGNVYLANYFMDEDVILITMNYRLGVLGFLSTQDSEIQGNMGLKDQIVAIRWVHENIIHFGGNASRTTIFGESAGGASVSYHLISPMSTGLFSQGISHSGTALCPWAFVRNPRRVAHRLARVLNCPTNSSRELLNCLRAKDINEIVTSQEKLTVWNRDPFALFGPAVEKPEVGRIMSPIFLPDTPFKLLCQNKSVRVPWILGVCEDEGLLFHAATILNNLNLTHDINNNWTRVAPVTLLFDETARDSQYVAQKVRNYYFGQDQIDQKMIRNLTNLYSDRYFFHCTRNAALLYARHSPTYLYQFAFHGPHSILNAFGLPNLGVAHGDDLQYFFIYSKFPNLALDTTPGQFSKKVIHLWKSFAETGDPSETWGDEEWCPISEAEVNGQVPLKWYALDFKPKMLIDPYKDRMDFWDHMPLHELKMERKIINYDNDNRI